MRQNADVEHLSPSFQLVGNIDSSKASDYTTSTIDARQNLDSQLTSRPNDYHGFASGLKHGESTNDSLNISESIHKEDTIKTKSFEEDVQHRIQAYTESCLKGNGASIGDHDIHSFIVADPDTKMAYCFIAKIACTFWLRIFSFLTRPEDMRSLGIKSPSEIDRAALHWGQLMPTPLLKFQQMQTRFVPTTVKFLFARNPYERLWSVYLDKYYLPDYWVMHPLGATRCGVNTTFGQFLNHAVTSLDHHLTPVSDACNPCIFKPDVVGKMETFTRDAKHILNQTGFGHFLENYNHTSYVEVEMTSLITYNFNLLTSHGLAASNCLTPKSLSQRLWKVFQINGHLRSESQFPDTLSDYSMQNVIDVFLKVSTVDPVSKKQSKKQRREAMVEAYSKVSPSLVIDIQERYRLDFEMFEYSVDPPT